MLMPSLFNGSFDLMNRFYDDPWFRFDDRAFKNLEKKLYGSDTKNMMNTDIKELSDGYEMTIDLPGFDKEDICVDLQNGYLIVHAEKNIDNNSDDPSEDESKNGNYIRRERYCGSCQRSFYVGDTLTHEDIKAKFKHGILTLDIPKKDVNQVEQKKYIAIEG